MYSSTKHYANALWGIFLLAMGMLWLSTALALAPAGYEIKNQATVTYQDSLGNEYTTISNESVVTVAEIYSGALENSQTLSATPGQMVYFPHQLINNGNADDRFTLGLNQPVSGLDDLKIYLDTNGDGLPSSGDQEISALDQVPVASGGRINLVVAASVPSQITTGASLSLALTAAAVGRPGSAITADATLTNTDTITLTDGAVLQVSKQVIKHKPATSSTDGEVTYRVLITNNGANLDNGGIYDFFPDFVKLDTLGGTITTDTRLGNIEIKEASGLTDELPTGTPLIPENNNDQGIYLTISGLQSGGSASLEFTVPYIAIEQNVYQFDAGALLTNRSWVGYGNKETQGPWEQVAASNLADTRLPQISSVSARNADNSGKEEVLASAPAGGVAEFINGINNLGNGQDVFNLSVSNTSFPVGTEFSLWDESGSIPLSDNSNDGLPDTGIMARLPKDGHLLKIMLRASLPANTPPGKGPYKALVIATSLGDPRVSDSVTNILEEILPVSVDLANFQATTDDIVFNGEVANITDFFKPEASADFDPLSADPVSTLARKPGEAAQFGLYIANRSLVSDSFGLDFKVQPVAPTSRTNQARWQVTWRDDGIYDKDGNVLAAATGAVISSTPLLPADTVMKVIATLELASDSDKVPAGAYDVIFSTNARGSGKSDSTLDRLTLTSEILLAFTPNGEGQVEAGSFIDYQHTLANNSNTALDVAIVPAAVSIIPPGWSYVVKKADNSVISTSDTAADYLTMAPGEEQLVTVRISAAATLPPGSEFVLPLLANGMTPGTSTIVVSASLTETTQVLNTAEARLISGKTVAGVDDSGTYGNFVEVLDTPVPPGQRVVWKVTTTNTSGGTAENVIIHEKAPIFTRLAPTSATGAAIIGNPKIAGIAATAKHVKVEGNTITFYVGDGADNARADTPGGNLAAGASVETTFEVVIE